MLSRCYVTNASSYWRRGPASSSKNKEWKWGGEKSLNLCLRFLTRGVAATFTGSIRRSVGRSVGRCEWVNERVEERTWRSKNLLLSADQCDQMSRLFSHLHTYKRSHIVCQSGEISSNLVKPVDTSATRWLNYLLNNLFGHLQQWRFPIGIQKLPK